MDWGRGGWDTALGKQGLWGKKQEHAEVAGSGVGAVGEHRLRQRGEQMMSRASPTATTEGTEGEQSREKMQWRWSEGRGVTSGKEVQASHDGES